MSDYDQYFEKFLHFTKPLGLQPTARHLEQIQRYLEELIRWNQKTNLTASEDFGDLLFRHVLDSLIPIAAIGEIESLLDVGTGAGFPGIPLKIFNLEWDIIFPDTRDFSNLLPLPLKMGTFFVSKFTSPSFATTIFF